MSPDDFDPPTTADPTVTVRFAPHLDIDDPLIARALWSFLVEPADAAAHSLIDLLGPGKALRWVAAAQPDLGVVSQPVARKQLARRWHRWRVRLADVDVDTQLRAVSRLGGGLLIPEDPTWPSALDDLGQFAPMCLWYRGDPTIFAPSQRMAAVVGSRAATSYGQTVTDTLTCDLVAADVSVISGGAFGIDVTAHRAALRSDGVTIAILAGGLDRLYPAANADVLERIATAHLLLSEVPLGFSPMRARFLQRNRIIAALGEVTVVTEASWRSGALNTARHAAELLRPVGAVPGPITSAASAGCHRLLRDGQAICITEAGDVLELLPGGSPAEPSKVSAEVTRSLFDTLDAGDRRVVEALPLRSGLTTEALSQRCGLPIAELMPILGRLSMGDHIHREQELWHRARMSPDR